MSRVITFSRTFPSYHPKAGQPTYFVEKIYNSLYGHNIRNWPHNTPDKLEIDADITEIKHHTIRAGNRWKAGDWFSPRVWSGKAYHSPQITIASDIEIKKVWNIGLKIRGDFKEFYCGDCDLTGTSLIEIANNDGLTLSDLFSWFNKPFEGQIICWNRNIKY